MRAVDNKMQSSLMSASSMVSRSSLGSRASWSSSSGLKIAIAEDPRGDLSTLLHT